MSPRRRRVVYGITALLCVTLIAGIVSAAAWVHSSLADDGADSWTADPVQLQLTQSRLTEVAADLATLPAPVGTSHGVPARGGCAVDSGDVHQPWISLWWAVPNGSAREAGNRVVAALRSRGWTGDVPKEGRSTFYLTTRHSGWSATALVESSIYDNPQDVHLWVGIDGARPCRLKK